MIGQPWRTLADARRRDRRQATMRRQATEIALIVVLGLVLGWVFWATWADVRNAEGAPDTVTELRVRALILDASARYGLDGGEMIAIAFCESRYDASARNWQSGALGVYQLTPATWAYAAVGAGVIGASPLDAAANVEAASWLAATDGTWQSWHRWGC